MNAARGHALQFHLHVALVAVTAAVVFSVFVLAHRDWFSFLDATGFPGINRRLVLEGIKKSSLMLIGLHYRL